MSNAPHSSSESNIFLFVYFLFARRNFLKVPSPSAQLAYNSGDSLISTLSGKVLTATSGSPREMISSAPSSGDENDESRFICIIRL